MGHLKDMIIKSEKKNAEYLIELHNALCLAIEERNWELVEFSTDNLEEFMTTAIIGINMLEME